MRAASPTIMYGVGACRSITFGVGDEAAAFLSLRLCLTTAASDSVAIAEAKSAFA